jgi:hypothetical protein
LLREDVEEFFSERKERCFADATMSRHQTLEKSHGRIETCTTSAVDATGWLTNRHGFADLKSIVMVESIREIVGAKKPSGKPGTTSLRSQPTPRATAAQSVPTGLSKAITE